MSTIPQETNCLKPTSIEAKRSLVTLIVSVHGKTSVQSWAKLPVTLGRSSECDLSFSDPTVSRVHAELNFDGETLVMRDLESRHGVLVNDVLLDRNGTCPIRIGDVIRLGYCSTIEIFSIAPHRDFLSATIQSTKEISQETNDRGSVPD